MDKTIKTLTEVLQESKKEGTTPYDTTAEVVRIEGNTAWVHIPGGIDETPVSMTIDARAGDIVQVRVSGGRAWITGNQSAPPTDDKKATAAQKSADNAKDTADDAKVTADNAEELAAKANRAAQNVNQYFWHTETDTGAGAGAHITEKTQKDFLDDPDNGGGNLLAQSGGILVRDGLFVLAKFGAETIIGQVCRTSISDGKFLVETDMNKYIDLEVTGTGLYSEIIPPDEMDIVFFNGGYVPHFRTSNQIGTVYTLYAIGTGTDYKNDTVSDRYGDVWIDDRTLTLDDFPNGVLIRYGEPGAAEVSALTLKASEVVLLPTTGANYLKVSSSKTELGGDVVASGDITANGHLSPIGYNNTGSGTKNNFPNNSQQELVSGISVTAGTWLLICRVGFPTNATGRRFACWHNNTTAADYYTSYSTAAAVSGGYTNVQTVMAIQVSGNTTFSVHAFQNSGSAMNVAYNWSIVRIA